jgi:hypothetical protein
VLLLRLAAEGLVVEEKKDTKFPEVRIVGLRVLTAHRMIFEQLLKICEVLGGQLAASGPRRRWGTPTGGCAQLELKLLRDRRPVEHNFPAVGPANTLPQRLCCFLTVLELICQQKTMKTMKI